MRILFRFCDYLRPDRIEVQIATQLKEIGVFINEDGLVSPLKEMTTPALLSVYVGGVGTVDIVHDLAQVGMGGLYYEVIVVGHEDVTVKDRAIFFLRLFEVVFEFIIVCWGEEYLSPLITSGCYVIEGSFVCYS